MEVWTGNLVRVGSNTPRYLKWEGKDSVWFRTYKEKKDIAFFDKKKNKMFFNSDYKMQFKRIKKQIIKDYQPKIISEYFNLT